MEEAANTWLLGMRQSSLGKNLMILRSHTTLPYGTSMCRQSQEPWTFRHMTHQSIKYYGYSWLVIPLNVMLQIQVLAQPSKASIGG